VFVHGLFGHPKNSWTCKKGAASQAQPNGAPSEADFADEQHDQGEGLTQTSGKRRHEEDTEQPPRKRFHLGWGQQHHEVYWPQDLLPGVIPWARIMTWGYDVQMEQMFSPNSQASIYQHSATLLMDLVAWRKTDSERVRPLIFVAHSLGGIVVKDALCLSRTERTFLGEIVPATAGVMFMGTPHRGSKVASIGKIALELSKLFLRSPNLKVLRALEVNSEILERVGKNFNNLVKDRQMDGLNENWLHVHSFQEELKLNGIMIVDSFSGTIGSALETTGSIRADHRGMIQFPSADDPGFTRVAGVLHRWAQDILKGAREKLASQDQKYPLSLDLPAILSTESERIRFHSTHEQFLSSLDSSDAKERIASVENAFRQTYTWLFNDQVGFEDWLKGKTESSIYWIQGKPGSGKSTVMKFALKHGLTRDCLWKNHAHPWVIAGFFFHDRGSMIAKSVDGLLLEVLYQILFQRKDLIPFIYPMYYHRIQTRSLSRDAASISDWRPDDVEEALLAIASQTKVNVNLCLFIDALDEHAGNHRELLRILNSLVDLKNNAYFHLRLCLASRPENVFRDAFLRCPGFAIHDFTVDDIRQFTIGNMQLAATRELTPEDFVRLNELTEDIIQRAQGVFLWVRLVVQELVEGLCEGDSIKELQEILATIPTELVEMYERALSRPRRTSLQKSKYRDEAYVMFQLVIHARSPFRVNQFLIAVLLSTTRDLEECERIKQKPLSEIQPHLDSVRRKLNSRCSGLLELVPGVDSMPIVQFIHQTVKEFMIRGKGTTSLYEDPSCVPQEEGHSFILRYLDWFQKSELNTEVYNIGFDDDFLFHARQAELMTQVSSLKYFKTPFHGEIGGSLKTLLSAFEFTGDLPLWNQDTLQPKKCPKKISRDVFSYLKKNQHLGLALVTFCIKYHLPASVKEKLESVPWIAKNHGGFLLAVAFRWLDYYENMGIEPGFGVIEALLTAGIDIDCITFGKDATRHDHHPAFTE
jgi:hypothetical protein